MRGAEAIRSRLRPNAKLRGKACASPAINSCVIIPPSHDPFMYERLMYAFRFNSGMEEPCGQFCSRRSL